jgi:hypothetical protein
MYRGAVQMDRIRIWDEHGYICPNLSMDPHFGSGIQPWLSRDQ